MNTNLVHKLWPLAVVLLGLTAGGLSGCAPQLDRIELSMQENRDQMSELQVENKRLLQEVQALGSLLRVGQDSGDESSAMRYAQLSQVSTRMDQLLRKLDDNAEYMRDLSARVDLLATRSGIPTLGEYKPPSNVADPDSPLTEEGRTILETAKLDRTTGNTELAKSGFQEFLTKYPDSEAADDAIYWLGDLWYGDGDWGQALGYFERLLTEFPDSEYLPSAMLKSRSSLLELGRSPEAWQMGGDLIARFPDSSEAALLKAEIGE